MSQSNWSLAKLARRIVGGRKHEVLSARSPNRVENCTPHEQKILDEYRRHVATAYRNIPLTGAQTLVDPYIVNCSPAGIPFRFLIGNTNGQLWYDVAPTSGWSELEVIRDYLIEPGDIVFDCGAHQGFYSLCMAGLTTPRGHVYAFEPFPQNCDLIDFNIRLNNCKNLTLVRSAVSDKTGKARAGQADQSIEFTSHKDTLDISTLALDDFTQATPTVLKLDVEGYEGFALRGARRLLATLPKIDLEVHASFLPRFGMTVGDVLGEIDWSRYKSWIYMGGKLTDFDVANPPDKPNFHIFAVPKDSAKAPRA